MNRPTRKTESSIKKEGKPWPVPAAEGIGDTIGRAAADGERPQTSDHADSAPWTTSRFPIVVAIVV